MTILAHVISESRGLSAITDSRHLDRFSIFTRSANVQDTTAIGTAQAVFELKLPRDISTISVDSIIRHRNRSGFLQMQRAFHQELDRYMGLLESGNGGSDFHHSLGSVWSDFSDVIHALAAECVAFGLGVWLLMASPQAVFGDAVRELAGGLVLTTSSTIAIRRTWNHTKTKRFTRKFLSDLSTLHAL